VLAIAALIGLLASLQGIMFAYGRNMYSLSRAGYYPKFLSLTSRKYQTPWVALIVGGVLGYLILVAVLIVLPAISADAGASASGVILFIYQVFVLGSVMLTPVFIHRMKDQRLIAVVLSSIILLAYMGLYFDPAHALGWMVLMGLGAGGSLVRGESNSTLTMRNLSPSLNTSSCSNGAKGESTTRTRCGPGFTLMALPLRLSSTSASSMNTCTSARVAPLAVTPVTCCPVVSAGETVKKQLLTIPVMALKASVRS
jgi:hypothetical protein